MSDGAELSLLSRARDAAADGDWEHAYDLLEKADAGGPWHPTNCHYSPRSPMPPATST